jgi:hypothetical protein
MSSEWIAFDFESLSVGDPNLEVGEFRRLRETFFFPSKEDFSSLVRSGVRSDERPCAARFFLKDRNAVFGGDFFSEVLHPNEILSRRDENVRSSIVRKFHGNEWKRKYG